MSSLRRAALTKHGLPPINESTDQLYSGASGDKEITNVARNQSRKNITPIEWNEFFDKKLEMCVGWDNFCVYVKGSSGPVFLLLHGGGYSGLTWACLTEQLSSRVECQIVAPDLRGHGCTRCSDEDDLSMERLLEDVVAIFQSYCDGRVLPTFIIGHSMGGALAVHAAVSERIADVVGLAVIDVVEGAAMEALSGMTRFLNSRPQLFNSVEDAIEWCVKTGTAKNLRSARVSMPSQIKKTDTGVYTWRINLAKTEPYWAGWFTGLSKKFINCKAAKLLVLAGVDRLDTDLLMAQMQGKFQNTILPKVGHAVQEDSPDQLADVLANFAIRFQFANFKSKF